MSLNHQKRYNRDIRRWLLNVFKFASRIDTSTLRRRHCPACGSAHSVWFANNGALNYDRCNKCSLIFMNPSLSAKKLNADFKGDDKIVMEYFRIIQRYTTRISRPDPMKDNALRDIYRFKRSGHLLDIGCSVGTFLHKAKYF